MTCHSSLHISTIKKGPSQWRIHPDSEIRGRPVSFWSKNKGRPAPPALPLDPTLPQTLRLNSLPSSPRMRCLSLLCDLASHPGRLNIARTIFLLTAPEIIKKSCNLHFCYGGFFTLPNTVYPRWVLRVVTHLSFHYVIEPKKCHISMQIVCNVLYF